MNVSENALQQRYFSKLPNAGTTIFSVMSALAEEYHAINLSQGFPEFPIDERLTELVYQYMREGKNQYAPMPGVLSLREEIAKKTALQYQYTPDPHKEITITAGATEALFATMAALIQSGDEVIVLEPAYDSYIPAILLNGGIPVPVHLNKDFSIDWMQVRDRVGDKTKMIVLNTPHNPTGTVLSAQDLIQLADVIADTPVIVLSDEVYEHIIFDDEIHHSVLRYSELRQRSVVVSSFGKTFHATGWKIGYFIAPEWITREIRKVHQFLQFSVHTPTQFALAKYLQDAETYLTLGEFYQRKRDLFLKHMEQSPLVPMPSKGTYFQLFSYKGTSELSDIALAEYLTKEIGVASIPISVFYQDRTDRKTLRFCFAKNDDTLIEAANRLSKITSL